MSTTRLTPDQKRVRTKNRANNLVSKMCARELWKFLTRTPHTTQELLHELLTFAAQAERDDTSSITRHRLKSVVAGIWECARYGWHQQAFGRPIDPAAVRIETTCRRARRLYIRAISVGQRIARAQADGTIE